MAGNENSSETGQNPNLKPGGYMLSPKNDKS